MFSRFDDVLFFFCLLFVVCLKWQRFKVNSLYIFHNSIKRKFPLSSSGKLLLTSYFWEKYILVVQTGNFGSVNREIKYTFLMLFITLEVLRFSSIIHEMNSTQKYTQFWLRVLYTFFFIALKTKCEFKTDCEVPIYDIELVEELKYMKSI